MKKTDLGSYGSKVAKFLIAGGLVAMIGFSACHKDNGNNATGPNATVTEADAAELTSDAVTPATGGFDAQAKVSVSIYITASAKFTCGEKKDTTISYSSPTDFIPNYSYVLTWNYQLDCNSGIPSQFAFSFSGASKYNGVLMSSSDNSSGSFAISDPGATSSTYTFGSTYERSGKQTSKVGYQKTFSSDLKMSSTNIQISKSTEEIVSGTASITITGTASNGNSFSFSGTITFLGNKKATLVLNSGTTYNIAWS
jgi:hypothetical protein